MLSLGGFVKRFAEALRQVDASGQAHKLFGPGIGPYGEADAIRAALPILLGDPLCAGARTKRQPDLLIPGRWALEFKVIRPYGDNGKLAEHWSENILHPYPGNTSALGDCLKLIGSDFAERRAVVVFGFEHSSVQTPLDPAIKSFELIARQILGISLSHREETRVTGLIHPVHQVLRVFGWEVLGSV